MRARPPALTRMTGASHASPPVPWDWHLSRAIPSVHEVHTGPMQQTLVEVGSARYVNRVGTLISVNISAARGSNARRDARHNTRR